MLKDGGINLTSILGVRSFFDQYETESYFDQLREGLDEMLSKYNFTIKIDTSRSVYTDNDDQKIGVVNLCRPGFTKKLKDGKPVCSELKFHYSKLELIYCSGFMLSGAVSTKNY